MGEGEWRESAGRGRVGGGRGERERGGGGGREAMNWLLSAFFGLIGEMRVGIEHNGSGADSEQQSSGRVMK